MEAARSSEALISHNITHCRVSRSRRPRHENSEFLIIFMR